MSAGSPQNAWARPVLRKLHLTAEQCETLLSQFHAGLDPHSTATGAPAT